jgi:hypothetical protein
MNATITHTDTDLTVTLPSGATRTFPTFGTKPIFTNHDDACDMGGSDCCTTEIAHTVAMNAYTV